MFYLLQIHSVLPRVSGQLPTGVINQNKQLTKLVSLSEKFSQCAYNRPLNKARHVQLGTEVTSGFHTRLGLLYTTFSLTRAVSQSLRTRNSVLVPSLVLFIINSICSYWHRLRSDDSDSDCVILQESPPSKRARRDNTSKWSVITGITTNYIFCDVNDILRRYGGMQGWAVSRQRGVIRLPPPQFSSPTIRADTYKCR